MKLNEFFEYPLTRPVSFLLGVIACAAAGGRRDEGGRLGDSYRPEQAVEDNVLVNGRPSDTDS